MEGYRLVTFPVLETDLNHLRFQVVHAADLVEGHPGASFTNRLSFARLFLIHSGSTAGSPSWACVGKGRRTRFGSGQAILLPPDRLCRMQFAPGLRMFAIHFSLSYAGGTDLFSTGTKVFRRSAESLLVEKIRRYVDAPERSELAMTAYAALLTIVAGFVADVEATLPHSPLPVRILPQVQRAMASELPGRWRVSQIADRLSLTPDALAKRFKRETGLAFKDYLTRELIRRSTVALLSGKEPVTQIAARLGFASDQYFSRFIKTHTAVTPDMLRQGSVRR